MAKLSGNQRFHLMSQAITGVLAFFRLVAVCGTLIFIAWLLQGALIAFAGQQTDANVTLKVIAGLHADQWFAYLFGGGGIGYGLLQRHTRRRNIRRLTKHTEALEKRLDKKRTSSGLTPTGRTRPEDR